MIELSQIINSMKGVNEKKEPKSGVSICEYILYPHDGLKTVREYFFTTPHINFIVQSEFIIVDLIFPKTGLIELRTAWNYLRKFGEQQTSLMDDEKNPVLEFTAVPLEHKGKYFCTLINPIYWALQPSDSNSNVNNSIRMLFEKAGVLIHEGEMLDDVTIDREIDDEIRAEERLEEYETEKKAEYEAELEREEDLRRKQLQI